MTCKDCYHCDVCSEKDGTTNFYGKELACNDVDKICQYFKDKSLIIELPIKATDKLKEELTKYCYERCVYEL